MQKYYFICEYPMLKEDDFQRKLKQRGRPTGAGAEGGVPLKGAVTK